MKFSFFIKWSLTRSSYIEIFMFNNITCSLFCIFLFVVRFQEKQTLSIILFSFPNFTGLWFPVCF